jgi:adhesin HecA-like repeat protein
LPDNRRAVEVLRPKPLETHPGDEIVPWAGRQLEIATSILDNPGGGLLSATQTIGQVKAGLHERDAVRWEEVVAILDRVEDAVVRREFDSARGLLGQVVARLGSA